ncbi:MAG: hypothetical protein ACFFA3_01350 [Promethearchaeota archaeon]
METSKILSFISIILCIVGGLLLIIFGIIVNIILIVLGVANFIGALVLLKYPRRGSILCLALGFIELFIAWFFTINAIYGTIFTLLASIVGFIGVMKK